MAARIILSNANALLPGMQSLQKHRVAAAAAHSQDCSFVTKRGICLSLTAGLLLSLSGKSGRFDANAAILEADDDLELLEKVRNDRKKRLERQGVLNSAVQETAYLQDLVYKLSTVGQAIDKNDLSTAGSVLGQSNDSDWVKKLKSAFNKLSSSDEEKSEVETFSSSFDSLISSVRTNDVEASRLAFVTSASAFEKWTTLTGLDEKLKGL